ncbi:MAG TPA: ATP-dependent Clp protease ATP-binding subunit [Chitinophagaceae bacterium]|nr:ATP-dependent Clp protease ATP-binding subunit [Chitinophagaceae bacterium]
MSLLIYNETLKSAFYIAKAFAKENYNEQFGSAHILRALLHKEIGLLDFLESINKDWRYMTEWAEVRIDDYPKTSALPSDPQPNDQVERIIDEADEVRLRLGLDEITPLCVLAALVKPHTGFSPEQLKSFPLREQEIYELYTNNASKTFTSIEENGGILAENTQHTGALQKYCTDKTLLARQGKLDPIIGRERETRQMIEILGRRSKPNVIITGEPGVGKTALIDGFAQAIINKDVPLHLQEAILLELDLGALMAGAAYKGEVEDRLKKIIIELKRFDKAILFIDEMHVLLDAKGPMGSGIGNLLKPELARGEITVIGATTLDEYRKLIEPEQAFNRRFELLQITEPDIQTAVKMVELLADYYEKHHTIKIEKEAIPECVRLAKRYIKDKRLPDAALDLLDRTMAAIRMMDETSQKELGTLQQQFEKIKTNKEYDNNEKISELKWFNRQLVNSVSPILYGQLNDETEVDKLELVEELISYLEKTLQALVALSKNKKEKVGKLEVAAVVASKTGIPIGKIQAQEKEKLLNMEAHLKRRMVGQEHALKVISDAIIESRSGINKAGQPIGSFFLLGPTGTGKTELAKSIAELLFNDEKAMIRFDMSEFKEEHSAALLYGAPPGYVGYEEGGMLVNKIRQQPYSVVLFDEIEKAHQSVFDIFLQIMDEGHVHDKLGKEGDFSNSLILFTSNIGSDFIIEKFGKNEIPKSNELMDAMSQRFRPEFLARLTEIVPFGPITAEMAVQIFNIQMRSLHDALHKQHITLKINDKAKKMLALSGFTPKYGARQIGGVIRQQIRRPISKMIVGGKLQKNSIVELKLNEKEELVWDVHS